MATIRATGDDRQQAFAATGGDGSQNVAHAVELAGRDGLDEARGLDLMGAEGTVLRQAQALQGIIGRLCRGGTPK